VAFEAKTNGATYWKHHHGQRQENTLDLSKRRVLVTGASSGIGEATAHAFAKAGAHVILISDQAKNLTNVLDTLLASGARALAAVTDLTKPDQIDGLIERMEAQVGPIDTIINNAGVGLGASILDTQLSDMRFMFEVNFFALHQLCQQALRLMAPRRNGYIINVTSAAGRFGSPTVAAYSASKGAVHAYTQALRIEASVYNVHVSEVLPISVRTRFFDSVKGEKYQPGGIVLTPERVAASIVRAASQKNPPAEVLPYRPIRFVFALDSVLPGALGKLAGRSYLRTMTEEIAEEAKTSEAKKEDKNVPLD
jgi:short-subunit dehydrogenase